MSERLTAPPVETSASARPGLARRLAVAVTTGSPWVVTLLAIVLALIVGAILIVVSDQAVLSKFSYFFAAPGDALGAAWGDIASAYGALFKGAIFDPGNASTLTDALHPITETITEATPPTRAPPTMLAATATTVAMTGGRPKVNPA